MEWEELQRSANRRWEREQGRRDATEDMSEDLSEGEKGDGLGEMLQCETPRKKFQRNVSNLEVWSDDKKEKKLYVILIRYSSFMPHIMGYTSFSVYIELFSCNFLLSLT